MTAISRPATDPAGGPSGSPSGSPSGPVEAPRTEQDWARPGPHELAPGVFRIPLPLPQDGLRATNVYALVGDDGVTLIDAGWAVAQARAELARALAAAGTSLDQVTDVLVTHCHLDHYTMAAAVRREFGSRVALGAAERINSESLARRHPDSALPQVALLRRAGAGGLADAVARLESHWDPDDWTLPDVWLEHDSEVCAAGRALRVVHTPGHTRGHVVYLDAADGLLFAGDHVLPHITPSIGFEQATTPLPLADFLASLRLLRTCPDARLLPGHGPVTGSVHARVDALLAHHEDRFAATLKALQEGSSTAHEVAGRLRWTRRERALAELDLFNAMLATLETAAHLNVLVQRGLVRVHPDGRGVDRYESASATAAAEPHGSALGVAATDYS